MPEKPEVPIERKLLLRIGEAAAMLSISERECYRLVASGRLKAVRLGSRRRITRDALEAFVAELTADAEALNVRMRRVVRSRRAR